MSASVGPAMVAATPRPRAKRVMIPVIRILNPFTSQQRGVVELTWSAKKTLDKYFPLVESAPVIVSVSGRIVQRDQFASTYLDRTDNIVVCLRSMRAQSGNATKGMASAGNADTAGEGGRTAPAKACGPRTLAALRLSFLSSLFAATVNAVFGTIIAWTLVRYRFPGRRLLDERHQRRSCRQRFYAIGSTLSIEAHIDPPRDTSPNPRGFALQAHPRPEIGLILDTLPWLEQESRAVRIAVDEALAEVPRISHRIVPAQRRSRFMGFGQNEGRVGCAAGWLLQFLQDIDAFPALPVLAGPITGPARAFRGVSQAPANDRRAEDDLLVPGHVVAMATGELGQIVAKWIIGEAVTRNEEPQRLRLRGPCQ